ncbi:MAG: SOS response-associated peptidase family protein, partial [Chloroflexi bacterium]|nr:SOS response-associated peptidase family protein [Chloroflexota bacterium]
SRDAIKKRRCIVPAYGFYEWTGPEAARQPLWFHRPDGGLLLFAGLSTHCSF